MVGRHGKALFGGSIQIAGAATVVLALALFAISCAPALAAFDHPVVRTFSTGAGTSPRAVATDADGNFYVFDPNRNSLAKFDSGGSPVDFTAAATYIDRNELLGTPAGPYAGHNPFQHFGVAVDSSGGPNDGDIYLSLEGDAAAAFVYDASGTYLGKLGANGCGVAVNQADGSVYVTNGASVSSYGVPSGDLSQVAPTGTLNTPTNCVHATDSLGAAYVAASSNPVSKYDAAQFGTASPTPALTFGEVEFSVRALGVDPADGSLYVDKGGQVFKYDEAAAQQGGPFGQLNESASLAVDAARDVVATDSGGGIFVFGPNEVQLPAGSTGGSSGVTATSASVEGSVDPDGAGGITGCEFRYGEDTGYADGAVPCTPPASSGTPIAAPATVGANLTGLVSGTTYHYRLFVTNANGTQMNTGDQTFTTPPATENVATGEATEVKKGSAVLNGSYTGDGQDVHYFFEWGRTTAYGRTTPAPPGGDAGAGGGARNVAPVQISGLSATTTYHYRLVVSTASGITRGQGATLTTPEAVGGLSADPPSTITGTSAELHGSFEGDSTYATTYHYEWGPNSDYGNVTPALPGGTLPAASGRVEIPGAALTGLATGSVYHYRVVASNVTGTSVTPDATFKTGEAPTLAGLNSRNLQATSAEIVGEVNPRLGHTTYRFEWGPTSTYGQVTPVPVGDLGAGNSFVPVSAALDGLEPGVTYHFRLVASNPYGTTASPDQTFGFYPPNCPNAQLRQETGADSLPDCRAYELVTPSFGQGATIAPGAGPPLPPFATSPSRIDFATAYGTFTEDTGDASNVVGDLYVATRRDTGWTQRYTALPASENWEMGRPPVHHEEDSLLQTWNLGRSQVRTQSSPNLDRVINYARGFPINASTTVLGQVSNAPFVWNSETGGLIERWPTTLSPKTEGFVGLPQASTDFNHFVFQSNLVFAPGGTAVPREITVGNTFGIYVEPIPPASIYDNDVKTGQIKLASYKTGNQKTFEGFVYNVSDDGSRILMGTEWLARGASLMPPNVSKYGDIQGPLYLRSEATHTYEIAPGHKITYVGSTADGKTVYLTSKEQLTADDHDQSADLYAWHESDQTLERISVGSFGSAGNSDQCDASWSGGGCSVEPIDFATYAGLFALGFGLEAGQGGNGVSDTAIASKSGDIYFLSPEQLIAGKGERGQANLYLSRGGTLRFVATMDPTPACTPAPFATNGCAAGPVARMQVTPDGSHMAFIVRSNVTGYDSHGKTEMYLYDPASGGLTCASCRPDSVPPTSYTYASMNGLFLTYDGRAFFSTEDPLVARDTDGVQDVYEYTEGRAQLITAGTGAAFPGGTGYAVSNSTTGLVAVSANGTDVYFATVDSLVTQDHNGAVLKIYDARVGGGFPAERTPPNCEAADECHGPGASPPQSPPDRTSANLGKKAKKHKAKKHRSGKHKAKKHRSGKQKKKKHAKASTGQRRANRD